MTTVSHIFCVTMIKFYLLTLDNLMLKIAHVSYKNEDFSMAH